MNNLKSYLEKFFEELEVYEDIHRGKNYKSTIHNSILEFLDSRTEENAYKVYEEFFKAYWIGIQMDKNPFIGLTQTMKNFEQNAGRLLDRQRDHYIHTIFVFILGLAIFIQNKNYKKIFEVIILNKDIYPDSYPTKNEEFFYRWGLASLFHDIAYPLEITLKQANKYLKFIWNYPEISNKIFEVRIDIPKFSEFVKLPKLAPDTDFKKEHSDKYPNLCQQAKENSIALLADKISVSFNLDFDQLFKVLNSFVDNMRNFDSLDHGLYSAIIMLRWYYYLVETTKWNPAYFYFPIVDSASAILLHNYYKSRLMKEPFNLDRMKAKAHPIAFLLILCDELQEWNRASYGEANAPFAINDFDIYATEKTFEITCLNKDGVAEEGYWSKKVKYIYDILEIEALFPEGIILK